MVKLTKSLLVTLIALLGVFPLSAGDAGDKPIHTPDVQHKGKLDKINNPNRKKAPSRDYVEYEYIGDGFCFYPNRTMVEMDVTIAGVDNAFSFTDTASVETGYYVHTGNLEGTYEIHCTTDDGSVYTGIVEL